MSTIDALLARETRFHVACSRSDDFIASLPDGCVNLAILDIPYFGVKDEDWDNAWPSAEAFLAWVGAQADMWRRVLAPNGSLYVFASPQMAWSVEGVIRERFEVLSNIRWAKPPHSTKAEMFVKENLRAPFPASETIIFAEQYGADGAAMGAAGYDAKCGEAHRLVFGRAFGDYLRAEIARAGVTNKAIAALFPSRSGGLTGCVSNWLLGYNCPTPEQYQAIREFLNASGSAYLRREYEDLWREYEDLRRPFFAVEERPYTDVWTYPTVGTYQGKHPCEKPPKMGADIVSASSRPGDVVADFYCGSGIFLAEAVKAGRRALGCDMSEHWADVARRRCEMAIATGQTRIRRIEKPSPAQFSLFTPAHPPAIHTQETTNDEP